MEEKARVRERERERERASMHSSRSASLKEGGGGRWEFVAAVIADSTTVWVGCTHPVTAVRKKNKVLALPHQTHFP